MNEIQFLNIDLDIEARVDLSPIIEEFGTRVSVMRYDKIDDIYIASFETRFSEENEIIEEYIALINGLSPATRTIWDNCLRREFDIGYDSGDIPNNFRSVLSPKSIELIARVGGSIAISIYPPSSEVI